jgi:hypothetical protein
VVTVCAEATVATVRGHRVRRVPAFARLEASDMQGKLRQELQQSTARDPSMSQSGRVGHEASLSALSGWTPFTDPATSPQLPACCSLPRPGA